MVAVTRLFVVVMREEVGLIMDGFTMVGRGHWMDEVGKLRRSWESFR